jgi:hypothetical protein
LRPFHVPINCGSRAIAEAITADEDRLGEEGPHGLTDVAVRDGARDRRVDVVGIARPARLDKPTRDRGGGLPVSSVVGALAEIETRRDELVEREPQVDLVFGACGDWPKLVAPSALEQVVGGR